MVESERKKTSKVVFIVVIVGLLVVGIGFLLFMNRDAGDVGEKSSSSVYNAYTLGGYVSINNYTSYSLNPIDGEEDSLELSSSQFELPEYLYDYRDFILIRVFFGNDDAIEDVKVVSRESDQVVEDISEDNLKKSIGYPDEENVIHMVMEDEIYLSNLSENQAYTFVTETYTTTPPEIINDLGRNCLIYEKDSYNDTFEIYVKASRDISTVASFSYQEFEPGDALVLMYQTISSEEFIEHVDESSIVFLSDYQSGDALSYQFEDYIYNDTDYDITLILNNSGSEQTEVIPAGQIYAFSWMTDSITIQY